MDTFTFGQWVMVKAHVITARKYYPSGRWREPTYYMQGRRKWHFYPNLEGWVEIHTPAGNVGNSDSTTVCLFRRELAAPLRMLVVGKTYRATGYYDPGQTRSYGDDDYKEPYLSEDKRHPVYLLRSGLRWQIPTMALAEDMEAIQ